MMSFGSLNHHMSVKHTSESCCCGQAALCSRPLQTRLGSQWIRYACVYKTILRRIHVMLQARYIILMFLSYPLAYVFRYALHPSHTSLITRHIFSLSFGLLYGFLCFGR